MIRPNVVPLLMIDSARSCQRGTPALATASANGPHTIPELAAATTTPATNIGAFPAHAINARPVTAARLASSTGSRGP